MEAIPTNKVVIKGRKGGGRKNEVYDKIINRVEKMSAAKTLPIQCENRKELLNLFSAMRSRIKKGSLKIRLYSSGNTIYLEKITVSSSKASK